MKRRKEKIGCFYGTFDPVHKGHIHMAKMIASKLNLDELMLIPLKGIPHKHDVIASVNQRFEMCQLACQPPLVASSIMTLFDLEGYDIQMIDLVKELKGDIDMYYILGSDVFLHMLKWQAIEEMIKKVIITVALREPYDLNEIQRVKNKIEEKGGQVVLVDVKSICISSTEIRRKLMENRFSKDLTQAVMDYIIQNELYTRKIPE